MIFGIVSGFCEAVIYLFGLVAANTFAPVLINSVLKLKVVSCNVRLVTAFTFVPVSVFVTYKLECVILKALFVSACASLPVLNEVGCRFKFVIYTSGFVTAFTYGPVLSFVVFGEESVCCSIFLVTAFALAPMLVFVGVVFKFVLCVFACGISAFTLGPVIFVVVSVNDFACDSFAYVTALANVLVLAVPYAYSCIVVACFIYLASTYAFFPVGVSVIISGECMLFAIGNVCFRALAYEVMSVFVARIIKSRCNDFGFSSALANVLVLGVGNVYRFVIVGEIFNLVSALAS